VSRLAKLMGTIVRGHGPQIKLSHVGPAVHGRAGPCRPNRDRNDDLDDTVSVHGAHGRRPTRSYGTRISIRGRAHGAACGNGPS